MKNTLRILSYALSVPFFPFWDAVLVIHAFTAVTSQSWFIGFTLAAHVAVFAIALRAVANDDPITRSH